MNLEIVLCRLSDGLMADENLKSLRQNPRFQTLVAELRRPPTKVQAQ